MKNEQSFFKNVCALAIPVALQSMLQSSFSIVDQIMIGQLGSVSVAGVGLAGKFSSIFSVLISAIGAVAGIMIAQYLGQENKQEVRRSFFLNLALGLVLAAGFTLMCALFSGRIMSLYTRDARTALEASGYLRILAATFLPMAGATLLAAMFRCMEKASLPLYAGIAAAAVNTLLNYLLIFGKAGFPSLGARGAAIATVAAQAVNFLLMLFLLLRYKNVLAPDGQPHTSMAAFNWKQYGAMLLPVLACELLWSLGENVYAVIYGNMSTASCAAMTLTNPIQGLAIGALCGLSQAAAVIIGKMLGQGDYDKAYTASKKLIWYGLAGSLILSLLILLGRGYYVKIYRVEEEVQLLTSQILAAYALILPFKIQNMILGGGITRSGGRTKYVMVIDLIGTWLFGVPLGMISAFLFHLSIPWVYFLLSLEECVRFLLSIVVFRKRKWMQKLEN